MVRLQRDLPQQIVTSRETQSIAKSDRLDRLMTERSFEYQVQEIERADAKHTQQNKRDEKQLEKGSEERGRFF